MWHLERFFFVNFWNLKHVAFGVFFCEFLEFATCGMWSVFFVNFWNLKHVACVFFPEVCLCSGLQMAPALKA